MGERRQQFPRSCRCRGSERRPRPLSLPSRCLRSGRGEKRADGERCSHPARAAARAPAPGVVTRSYQRALGALALGAGSAGCARTGLGTHVRHTSPPCGPFPLCNYSRAPPFRLPQRGAPMLHPKKSLAPVPRGALLPVSSRSVFEQLSRCNRCHAVSSGGLRYYQTGSKRLIQLSRTPRQKPEQMRIWSGCSSIHSTMRDPDCLVKRMPGPSQVLSRCQEAQLFSLTCKTSDPKHSGSNFW